ncbi:hypothetical protein QC764_105535 [Podospora pseudoanserina]|uniref:Uncharacterized protein n=1 Tax=Podospora pseudoanserina TaxID=2609844 RepID=A0ABR0IMT5_9PEZI|nr:hypothetical protein QC764_105535 [Podospora pseudoanserina]
MTCSCASRETTTWSTRCGILTRLELYKWPVTAHGKHSPTPLPSPRPVPRPFPRNWAPCCISCRDGLFSGGIIPPVWESGHTVVDEGRTAILGQPITASLVLALGTITNLSATLDLKCPRCISAQHVVWYWARLDRDRNPRSTLVLLLPVSTDAAAPDMHSFFPLAIYLQDHVLQCYMLCYFAKIFRL